MTGVLSGVGFCFSLLSLAACIVVWGQLYEQNARRINWEAPFEVGLVAFIVYPVLVILRGIFAVLSGMPSLVDGLMIIAGLTLAALALENIRVCRLYSTSEMWPTTWGKIYNLALGELPPYSTLPHLPGKKLVYVYSVEKKQYTGHRIDAHRQYENPLIRRPLRRYPRADETLIYYCPDDPAVALLVPGVNWSSVSVFLGWSVGFILAPVLYLLA